MWNLVLVHLETVLVLVQDRCTGYAKCTIGLEIILDAQFCIKRTIDTEIILVAPNGTPC
jgi:hypothetical protein